MDEIVNKVKQSGLKTLDLAQFIPQESVVVFDLKDYLWQELILKEKDFRAALKDFDWMSLEGKAVAIICSADAIVPTWAFMLVASYLQKNNIKHIVGSPDEMSKQLIKAKIEEINPKDYTDARIIVKGCADIAVPNFAMTYLVTYLQNEVKSLMYGEPCSTVPIYKAPKK
ncbi:Protein of unknown function [Lishizhenia tianjinensis]|uniref:DUF2480 family protein n=1 Tax=Lishizhenia tianjinensis TaxID=477690 RepID=A0A1I7AY80_9FLAO|nr:DUF2480 family protein [Lishizhenia tianjinensis]SFT79914.1 Protein of unknown function [Lishizhenia tianjinensis]